MNFKFSIPNSILLEKSEAGQNFVLVEKNSAKLKIRF